MSSDRPKIQFKDRSGRVHTVAGGRPASDSSEEKPVSPAGRDKRGPGGPGKAPAPRPGARPAGGPGVVIRPAGSAPAQPRDSAPGPRPGQKPDKKFGKKFGKKFEDDRRGGAPGAKPGKKKFDKKFDKKGGGGKFDKKFEKKRSFEGKRRRADGPTETLKGIVDKNQKGFGFIAFEDRKREDSFVPPHMAEKLFHGDRVEATIDSEGDVLNIKVLAHRFRELVGRYTPHPAGPARGGWVTYERKRAREEILIPDAPKDINEGDWVRVKLQFSEKGSSRVLGTITEQYGSTLPPSADLGMVAAEFNLIEEHSAAAVREAEALGAEVRPEDIEGREDLRNVPFITIDGETARDFDDAVYVERAKGGFVLWVAIADVSHYVKPGTSLDNEARSRGTSVYFPEKAFHMLPRALSENLCSLKPNVDRLSMVARIEMDAAGNPKHTDVMDAVIRSKRRATYTEIQAEWEANGPGDTKGSDGGKWKNPDWEYAPHFELYRLIRKNRAARGSIDFDLPEAEMNVKPTGEVVSIKMRGRNDAHRLIEEFMIGANEAVTEWALKRQWPFVYRVHEEPAEQTLEKFQKLAAHAGVKVSFKDGVSPKVLAEVVRQLEGHPAQAMLNQALLRSMKQAIYSSEHGEHYGLASEGYTHFTSPIRRYPDLVVHRMLRWALRVDQKKEPALKGSKREEVEKDLAATCEHCSYRERLASEAERESIKLKQVRAMVDHLGEQFDGKIVGMIENGFFVQTQDPYVEGLVSKDVLNDDAYVFNEDRLIFYGRRTKRTFKIGDVVKVVCLRADLDRRQIEFGLAGE